MLLSDVNAIVLCLLHSSLSDVLTDGQHAFLGGGDSLLMTTLLEGQGQHESTNWFLNATFLNPILPPFPQPPGKFHGVQSAILVENEENKCILFSMMGLRGSCFLFALWACTPSPSAATTLCLSDQGA